MRDGAVIGALDMHGDGGRRLLLPASARDTVLLVVPLYHTNALGVVYSAPAVGAKLVLPGQRMVGASRHRLIEEEGVIYSAAVSTVCQSLLQHVREVGGRFSMLERVMIGGSACPVSIVRAFREDYGVDVVLGGSVRSAACRSPNVRRTSNADGTGPSPSRRVSLVF